MPNAIRLGVNIDHVATLREARGTSYPDPLQAAFVAVDAGADGITVHLREDRRHIQAADVERLIALMPVPINLEMAAVSDMLEFARCVTPEKCCIVPERRAELTTEGGLDVRALGDKITPMVASLSEIGVEVSLFIDPDPAQIDAAHATAAPAVELHTGAYANARDEASQDSELQQILAAAQHAHDRGLIINAGHGLNYQNVARIALVPQLNELNIGHAIVARAVLHGFAEAVREMRSRIREAAG